LLLDKKIFQEKNILLEKSEVPRHTDLGNSERVFCSITCYRHVIEARILLGY